LATPTPTALTQKPRHFALGRQPPLRGELVDRSRKQTRELLDHLVPRQASAARQLVDDVATKRIGNLIRGDVLVGAGIDPGVDRVAKALLLELLDEAAESISHIDEGDNYTTRFLSSKDRQTLLGLIPELPGIDEKNVASNALASAYLWCARIVVNFRLMPRGTRSS
jgi:hypothetical protein